MSGYNNILDYSFYTGLLSLDILSPQLLISRYSSHVINILSANSHSDFYF